MADEKHETLLSNRNSDISPDHTAWIKEQFNKKRFISARGREVWIKAPGRNLSRIVNIPDRESPNYKKAWIDVYNLCLDYLEGMVNSACLENKFIQRMGNVWMLNGHVVIWPKFNKTNANYARGLEKILEEYSYVKTKYIESLKKSDGIKIKKSSVELTPRKTSKVIYRPVPKPPVAKPTIPTQVSTQISERQAVQKPVPVTVKKTVQRDVPKQKKVRKEQPTGYLKIQKISDGDILTSRDYSKLKEENTDILVLTCMNLLNTKEEDIFLTNARNSLKEGLKTGVFIYGHAQDEHEGAKELKILLKILSKFSSYFLGLIFYSVDNEYIRKNKNDEEKILDYINVYNAIITTLKRAGYKTIISMNLESGKIISNVMQNNNMQQEHNVILMVVVRDVGELNKETPKIIVDPWNDFDVVELNNRELENMLIK